MPSKESSIRNINKAIGQSMRRAALKKALRLKEYLKDPRVAPGLKEDLKENGIEIIIKD
jgi:hypothetical protein